MVDENREWFKSKVGLTCTQGDRDISFCGHAVLENDLFCINDTLLDERFADNPMVVSDPPIRFYAGQSITGPGGHKIGVLCIKDHKPREFSETRLALLKNLARWSEIEINYKDLAHMIMERKEKQIRLEKLIKKLQQSHSELKKTQESLIQSEKMASIGQLAAGVAHEINNPIGFIGSNIEILREYFDIYNDIINVFTDINQEKIETPRNIDEIINDKLDNMDLDYLINDTKKILMQSEKGIERIAKIVYGLRTFSHGSDEDPIISDINEIIQNSYELTKAELKYKVKVSMDLKATSSILCYPLAIGQVLINLLLNAAQAIEDQGNIQIQSTEDQKNIYVTISDDGPGMDEKTKLKIFDPFFTTKPVGKGTGLGLSICYEIIVERHNGKIEVDSQLGQGAQFLITLPKHQT